MANSGQGATQNPSPLTTTNPSSLSLSLSLSLYASHSPSLILVASRLISSHVKSENRIMALGVTKLRIAAKPAM